MKDMMRETVKKINKIGARISEDHIGAYAAQSAYFLMLSLIPLLLMFLTLVQYTPLTKADVIVAVETLFPSAPNKISALDLWLISIINEVYAQSGAVVPVTAVVVLWSAGRGVLAVTTGLNCIYRTKETRNYIFLRIRAAFYTLILGVLIVFSMLLLVFGNSISKLVNSYIPFLKTTTDMVIGSRTLVAFCLFILFFALIYRYLPNHRSKEHRAKSRKLFPGAFFSAVSWLVISFVISIYVNVFKGFRNMYGSLTTLVLLMLWMYFCIYALLLGGELNVYLEKREYQTYEEEQKKNLT